jgi:beta-fructofuranosidase
MKIRKLLTGLIILTLFLVNPAAGKVLAYETFKLINLQYVSPTFHFNPPSGVPMGDPHPFYDASSGYWHLFYGPWHHARTQDMVHYEYLARAMTPSTREGEVSLFSGGVTLDKNGKPVILYTSIGQGVNPLTYSEVWGASGTTNLITWTKFTENPLYKASDNNPFIYNFRDPYPFYEAGNAFMILGGHLTEPAMGGAVSIYRGLDNALKDWHAAGILLNDQQPSGLIECPFMFKQNGKWCLGFSSARGTEYMTGTFNATTAVFTPQYRGWIETNRKFMYAPSIASTSSGRTVLWGMLLGNRASYWTDPTGGCATLPRELTLTSAGRLLQNPVSELASLRGASVSGANLMLNNQTTKIVGISGDQIDIQVTFAQVQATRYGVKLLCSTEEERDFDISFYGGKLVLDNGVVEAAYSLLDITGIQSVRVIVDKSIVEVYVNGGQACFSASTLYIPNKDTGVKLFAEGGSVQVSSFTAYEMSN